MRRRKRSPSRPARAKPPAADKAGHRGEALAQGFARAMAAMPWPGAIGVSGGADSLALMLLLADWARTAGKEPPLVFCVDHGLRPESGAEAKKVVRWAKQAGLKSEILSAAAAKPKSDIEAWARAERLSLMGEALARHKLAALYLAHHQDDQAETFLLRLARGSGLDGLSAMRNVAPYPLPGFEAHALVRPLLDIRKSELLDFLKARGQPWLEDPMNGEPRFARNRIRALLPALEEAGLSVRRIAEACAHMARAREALELATVAVLARACRKEGDLLLLDPVALGAAPREIGLRALAALLNTVSGAGYRPRFESLERLFDSLAADLEVWTGATLDGCHIAPAPRRHQAFGPKTLVIARESSRKAGPRTPAR